MYQFKHALVEDIFDASSHKEGCFSTDANIFCDGLGINKRPCVRPEEVIEWLNRNNKIICEPILGEVKTVLIKSSISKENIFSSQGSYLEKKKMESLNSIVDTDTNRILLTPKLYKKSPIRDLNSDLADRLLEEVYRGIIDGVDATLLFVSARDSRSMIVSFDTRVNEVADRLGIPHHDTRVYKQLPFSFEDPWGKRIYHPTPG